MIWVSTGMAYISAINSLTCIVCAGKDRKAAHIRAQANDGAWGWTGASETLQRGAHQIHSRTRAEQWRFRESKAVSVCLLGVHEIFCCKRSSLFHGHCVISKNILICHFAKACTTAINFHQETLCICGRRYFITLLNRFPRRFTL